MIMKTREVCAAVLAVMLLGISFDAAAQKPAADPWKKVPAPPAGCLYDDEYPAKLNAATEALNAEIEKQEELNAKVKKEFDQMDIMEKARRMQAAMMKNPQQAQQMLMAQQATGETVHKDLPAATEAAKKLTAKLETHKTSLQAAVAEAVKPAHAKRKALIEAKTKLVGEVQAPVFVDMAGWQEYVGMVGEENAAREKACASYFGPKGVVTTWLQDYKTQVIDKMHSTDSDAEAAFVAQMAIMDTPTEGYRSTQPLRAVREYLQKAGQVYDLRPKKTLPVIDMKPAQ